jgi:hypothetical protein
MSCRVIHTELSIWEFPFLGGSCRQWEGILMYMIMCEWFAQEGHCGQFCVKLYTMDPLDSTYLIFIASLGRRWVVACLG